METGKKAYFISDLHLGASYFAHPLENEKRVVRFLDSIRGDAAQLYLVGDILDYWYEYRYVVPRGFVRFFGKLAQLADEGVKITWTTGNHDVWLFDYLSSEIGLTVWRGCKQVEIMGKQFVLSHGDDVGRQRPMYRFTRWCFYNKVCQALYAAIHPRWTYPIAHGWSTAGRMARSSRDAEKAKRIQEAMARGERNLMAFSTQYAIEHPEVDYFVYGHLHIAKVNAVAAGKQAVFLGDWIRQYTYAVFDGTTLQLRHFEE